MFSGNPPDPDIPPGAYEPDHPECASDQRGTDAGHLQRERDGFLLSSAGGAGRGRGGSRQAGEGEAPPLLPDTFFHDPGADTHAAGGGGSHQSESGAVW